MDAANPHILHACFRFDLDFPICGKRLVILRNLISLRQVWIEIILAGEDAFRMDLAAESQSHADRQFHRFLVQHRERTRLTRANRADVAIRLGSDRIDNFTSAKHLGFSEQLSVDFESDDGFVFHR
jgi:hypothetical protein